MHFCTNCHLNIVGKCDRIFSSERPWQEIFYFKLWRQPTACWIPANTLFLFSARLYYNTKMVNCQEEKHKILCFFLYKTKKSTTFRIRDFFANMLKTNCREQRKLLLTSLRNFCMYHPKELTLPLQDAEDHTDERI